MAKSTLSVDEAVLAAVRRGAAKQTSSVNALVREYLNGLAAQQDRAARARERIRELSKRSKGCLGKKTWTRDDFTIAMPAKVFLDTNASEDAAT